jgi:ubiquinone/menaquinone biosynthesis C-methylase UbiE
MVNLPGQGAFLDPQGLVSAVGIVRGMRVADLGCGSGHLTVAFARAVGDEGVVTAVDVRSEPLDEVRAKAEAAGLGNVRTARADLEVRGGTGIPDNSQDIAVLTNVLFQSQKKDAIVGEAVRMLRPGGRLVVTEWKKGTGGFGPPDELRIAEDALKALVEQSGLRLERPLDAGQYCYGLIFIKPS